MATDLLLNCWLVGDEPESKFSISISNKYSVDTLKLFIAKKKRNLAFNEVLALLDRLEVWKASIPSGDDVTEYAGQLKSDEALPDEKSLSDLFPSPADGYIHIIARFKPDRSSPPAKRLRPSKLIAEQQITESCWDLPYKGDAASAFIETTDSELKNYLFYHAQYIQVIQSSGTGKSRMIDEVSKTILTIPINLGKGNKVFPPPDSNVRNWLDNNIKRDRAYERFYAFLGALSTVAQEYIEKFVLMDALDSSADKAPVDLPNLFWNMMRAGQTCEGPGPERIKFFARVIELATKPDFLNLPSDDDPNYYRNLHFTHNGKVFKIYESFATLLDLIEKYTVATLTSTKLLLAFDEAQVLYYSPSHDSWCPFNDFRTVLQRLKHLGVIPVFLATSGEIVLPLPAASLLVDPSSRIMAPPHAVHAPFTALGFDQFAHKVKDGQCSISDVTEPAFMFSMGRPLFGSRSSVIPDYELRSFAMRKLTCTANGVSDFDFEAKFASIAVRIPLEFHLTTHAAADTERNQIEKHMRIALQISESNEHLVSIAPSEPVLVEGAMYAMAHPIRFDVPRALLQILKIPHLKKDYKGETVSMLLMLLARDRMSGSALELSTLELLQSLLNEKHHTKLRACRPTGCNKTKKTTTLEEAFQDSHCHYTHFVKVNDLKAINRQFLWRMMVRGAAILCADNQRSVDIIIPVCIHGTILKEDNMTAILVQSRNDPSLTSFRQVLFDLMHPATLGIFPNTHQPPIIRIVLSLGSQESHVSFAPEPTATNESETMLDYEFAYDVWASRACHETFSVIPRDHDSTYEAILRTPQIFPWAYNVGRESSIAERVRRTMHPCAGSDERHWATFAPM